MNVRAVALASLTLLLAGCNGRTPAQLDDGASKPVAMLGGEPITQGELDAWIKDELWRNQTDDGNPTKVFSLRQRGLDRMIEQRLIDAEAQKRGVSPDQLLDDEAAKRVSVSDADVKAFYEQNRARWGDRTLEAEAAGIRAYLERQKGTEAAHAYVAELRSAANVSTLLEQPRIALAGRGHSKGPENAPVTVVEFSDYECPFCRRAEPTVTQMLQEYAGKVRFEYRHFPLESIHPKARAAGEAAACADEQGRFWEYHAQLFTGGDALAQPKLVEHATKLGLDVAAFQSCLGEGRGRARVDADVAAGQAAGVTGTPAFFVNGVPYSGAIPIEEFRRAIDAELAKAAPQG
jgi:predicted DsbA family dithiol-disulfide isomerase